MWYLHVEVLKTFRLNLATLLFMLLCTWIQWTVNSMFHLWSNNTNTDEGLLNNYIHNAEVSLARWTIARWILTLFKSILKVLITDEKKSHPCLPTLCALLWYYDIDSWHLSENVIYRAIQNLAPPSQAKMGRPHVKPMIGRKNINHNSELILPKTACQKKLALEFWAKEGVQR